MSNDPGPEGERLIAERLAELAPIESGRVHAAVYIDPEVFEAEIQSIFYGTWLYVAHESEVASPGDFKTAYMGRVPVIVTRDDGGEVNVLVNSCPVCAATVCQLQQGNTRAFHCAFHDWYFDNRGELAGEDVRLQRLARVEAYRGLYFACFSPTAPDLARHLGPARAYIDLWADQSPTGSVRLGEGSWSMTFAGNWKLYAQSAGDGYRAEYVRATEPPEDGALLDDPDDERRAIDLGNGHAFLETDTFDRDWRSKYDASYVAAIEGRIGSDRAAQTLGFEDWSLFVFPNLCLNRRSLRVIRPIAANESEVIQRFVELPEAPDELNERRMRRLLDLEGPAGRHSANELEMLERSQRGHVVAEASDRLNAWVMMTRGMTAEVSTATGQRIGHISSEVGVRAPLRAWAALLKGEAYATAEATAPLLLVETPRADRGGPST